MFWRRRKKITEDITKDLKSVAEVAGDQIAPGVGTFALVLGGLAVAGVGAYVLHRRNKNKKAAASATASSKNRNPD
jgi:LPXTG-motif cell wall-anchored protein